MALSKLQIWNMAIAELPDARIDTLDEVSVAAEACADQYQPALELLLEDHPYDFATRRQALAVVANDRAAEWRFAYQLPKDLARPLLVLPYDVRDAQGAAYNWSGRARGAEASEQFRIAGRRLYANREAAVLEYVTHSPTESEFTAKFARALALELASRIVMAVKKDQARQQALIQLAEIARERAKADDMNRDRESPRDFIPEAQLVREGIVSWR